MSLTRANRFRRGPRAAVVLTVAAVAFSGCSDDAFTPGMAARVGDTEIGLDRVDEAGEDMCELYGELTRAGASQVVAKGSVRDSALVMLVMRELGDQLAAEHDVEPSKELRDRVSSMEEQLTEFEVEPELAEEVLPLASSIDYFVDIALQIGGGRNEEAYEAGVGEAQQWVEENGLDVNPRFEDIEIVGGDALVQGKRVETSVAVSDFATKALEYSEAPDPDPEHVQSLPESQRCG